MDSKTTNLTLTKQNDLYMKLNNIFASSKYGDNNIDKLINKIDNNEGVPKKYLDFGVNENKQLIYMPLNIIVLKKTEINDKMQELYDDKTGYYNNIEAFYKHVRKYYGNITREECQKFLESQSNYQMTKKTLRVNKPIISLYPNKMWCIDLIEMTDNTIEEQTETGRSSRRKGLKKKKDRYLYILDCVDVFSKKCFLEALIEKSSVAVMNALKKIIRRVKVQPKMILADNGPEFAGEFEDFCEENHIHLLHTRSYSAQSNGIVENKNKQVRRTINSFIVKNNTNNWYLFLDDTEKNLNNKYNSSIKASPNSLWNDSNDRIYIDNDNNQATEEQIRILRENKEKNARFKEKDTYQIGDLVRVKMSIMYHEHRKMEKNGDSKKLPVEYTPEIYEIIKIIDDKQRKRYIVGLTKDEVLCYMNSKKKVVPKQFYASQLQVVNDNPVIPFENERALELNRINENYTDVHLKKL